MDPLGEALHFLRMSRVDLTAGIRHRADEDALALKERGKVGNRPETIKDFPKESLIGFGLEAVHPDDFVLDCIDLNAGAYRARRADSS